MVELDLQAGATTVFDAATRELLKAFGKRVRDLRQSLGVSQEKLAELAGLHRTYIGAVERGEKNISLINLVRLASALGHPLEVVCKLDSLIPPLEDES